MGPNHGNRAFGLDGALFERCKGWGEGSLHYGKIISPYPVFVMSQGPVPS